MNRRAEEQKNKNEPFSKYLLNDTTAKEQIGDDQYLFIYLIHCLKVHNEVNASFCLQSIILVFQFLDTNNSVSYFSGYTSWMKFSIN